MGLTLITPAATLPVSLAEVKLYLRIEATDQDTLLDTLIRAAAGHISERTGRPIGAAGWRLTLDAFSDAIELPRAPVTAALVKYVDPAGITVTLPDSVYTLDLSSQPQFIVRNEGESWPTTLSAINVVMVDFTAGFDAATLPDDLKLAVMMLVEHWFTNRGASDVPNSVEALIARWRTLWVCA